MAGGGGVNGDENFLDPLEWARHPRSKQAMELLISGAADDARLARIFRQHVADGVCDEEGNMFKVWAAGRWCRPPWYLRVNHVV